MKKIFSLTFMILALTLVTGCGEKKEDKKEEFADPEVASASFEKEGNGYVLKNESGDVLIYNIKIKGKFCNRTTYIRTNDDKTAIINDKGEFIVDYGVYNFIDQDGCFFEVSGYNENGKYETKFLKYDGSFLIEDDGKTWINSYYGNMRYVLLTTKTQYKVLSHRGDTLLTFDKMDGVSEPIFSDDNKNIYLSVIYNNKTYVYNMDKLDKIMELSGDYRIVDVNKNNDNQMILMNVTDETTIILNNDKKTFETKCKRASFVNDEVRCLIENGGVFKYYDIKGNEINKD